MTPAEKYCARKVCGKLTKAIVLLAEAGEAAKAISPETIAGLQSKNLIAVIRSLVREATELRRGMTPADAPPFQPARVVAMPPGKVG